jgi:signal recognition particle receptor subunit beta
MALVNHTTREINAKIVYYGPGLCGKTTNIHLIYHRIAPGQRGKLISLATETDRTLFFDFLPVELGTIKNYKVRFHLYTVPGQVFYNATRKLVLKGADGVIFVADSQRAMLDANVESMTNLRDNFADQGVDLNDFPMVVQYNKRDLPDIMSIEELNAALNPRDIPFYEAVAMTGEGVLKTFTAISKLVLQDMQKNPERHNFTLGDIIGKGEKGPVQPKAAPKEAPPVEPSMPGAPMAEAKPEMAALEQAVDAGMKVNLGKAFMEDSQIILPFDVLTHNKEDQFQLRVSIDMEAPLAKRFKIVVKNFKKQ